MCVNLRGNTPDYDNKGVFCSIWITFLNFLWLSFCNIIHILFNFLINWRMSCIVPCKSIRNVLSCMEYIEDILPVPCSSPVRHSAPPQGSPPGSRPCSDPLPSHGAHGTWPRKKSRIMKVSFQFTYKKKTWCPCAFTFSNEHPKGVTYVTDDVPALLSAEKWDVVLVQLVATSLSLVPLMFVCFLEWPKVDTELTNKYHTFMK